MAWWIMDTAAKPAAVPWTPLVVEPRMPCMRREESRAMRTTVHFASDRVVTDAGNAASGYKNTMVPPTRPQDITYGTAFIDGVDVAMGAQGTVSQIVDVNQGGFSQQAIG